MSERICGLIGEKLLHSYSVPIQRALGNMEYRLYEMNSNQVEHFLMNDDIAFVNVTIPYKRAVIKYCGQLSPLAKRIGSVNTIVRRCGVNYGYNTDYFGFSYMAKQAGIDFNGAKVLVLGSGGASLTAQLVASDMGAESITVISRTGENNYDNLDMHSDAQIIVNATPVGMYPNVNLSPVTLSQFPECKGVLDMIYNPLRTQLLLQAEQAEIPHSDGLPMLVAQAAAANALVHESEVDENEISRVLGTVKREKMNLVLVGMPGSGKSTVGKELCALTGRKTVDLDSEIEESQGRSIPEIFADKGEEYFRMLEHELAENFGSESGLILVTGGGIVKDKSNYVSLHRNGRIYLLERDTGLLERDGRPLSMNCDLMKLRAERQPLYLRYADAVINNNGSPQHTAERIWRDFCENTCY